MSCMITVQQVITLMEQLAPRSYAESWDNVGLMVGDRNVVVTGVVTTLDVTEETVEYAIEQNCNLIVSHHPLIFKGLKQISCDTAQGRTINKLIQILISLQAVSMICWRSNWDLLILRASLKLVKRRFIR